MKSASLALRLRIIREAVARYRTLTGMKQTTATEKEIYKMLVAECEQMRRELTAKPESKA